MATYNGWTNFETWRVNLEIFECTDCDFEYSNDIDKLANSIEQYVYDVYTDGIDNQLAIGLIDVFLRAVNYREIAEHIAKD